MASWVSKAHDYRCVYCGFKTGSSNNCGDMSSNYFCDHSLPSSGSYKWDISYWHKFLLLILGNYLPWLDWNTFENNKGSKSTIKQKVISLCVSIPRIKHKWSHHSTIYPVVCQKSNLWKYWTIALTKCQTVFSPYGNKPLVWIFMLISHFVQTEFCLEHLSATANSVWQKRHAWDISGMTVTVQVTIMCMLNTKATLYCWNASAL